MTNANLSPFSSIDTDEYIKYIEMAEQLISGGYYCNISVVKLAEKIYIQRNSNESEIN